MSVTATPPFSKADSSPQSIQRLLDENAQLIKALVENMSTKGKSMECIQYQQTLHRNLVFLAGLADPNLNIQSLLPTPGSSPMPPRPHTSGQLPSTSAPYSTSAIASPASGPMGGSSVHPPTTHNVSSNGAPQPQQMPPRQPQATMQPTATSSDAQWSANTQAARATPPTTMVAPGQFSAGGMRNYDGSMWSNQGQQQSMYGMQRGMGGGGGGPGSGYGMMMGMSPEERQRQQQILRMRQEQFLQAQQMRRIQMQQQQQSSAGPLPSGGGMYPGVPHGPPSGMIPPGYPQTTMMPNPMSMPPGPMNMQ